MQNQDQQIESLRGQFGDAIVGVEKDRAGCPVVWVRREKAIDVLRHLKTATGLEYLFLSDLTAYDEMGSKEESQSRFVVVYNLFSPQSHARLRVKVRCQESESVPTASVLWKAANWAEREVYDMFGIRFEGHPDLRRILMDIRWEGHPLRKDYPIRKYQLFNDPEKIPENLLREE